MLGFLRGTVSMARMPQLLCMPTQRVYTLPPVGESRGSVFAAYARIFRQDLRQRRGHRSRWCLRISSLKIQDVLTTSLQGADLGFDTGKGLGQILLQESIDRLVRLLTRASDERLNIFEGQSQGTQVLDCLHTSECFFPKQAVIALAPAQGAEESEVLVGAQDFDRYPCVPG